jgi:hypothetical protein
MLQQIFSIYDSKIEAYMQPFFMPTTGAAIRMITDALDDPAHTFTRHPEDYTLFHLGSYEDGRSVFEIRGTPQSLAVLSELMQPKGVSS